MEERLNYFHERVDEVEDRLDELDREWDIERPIEANASALALSGLVFALSGDRKWLGLPVVFTDSSFNTRSRAGVRPCRS